MKIVNSSPRKLALITVKKFGSFDATIKTGRERRQMARAAKSMTIMAHTAAAALVWGGGGGRLRGVYVPQTDDKCRTFAARILRWQWARQWAQELSSRESYKRTRCLTVPLNLSLSGCSTWGCCLLSREKSSIFNVWLFGGGFSSFSCNSVLLIWQWFGFYSGGVGRVLHETAFRGYKSDFFPLPPKTSQSDRTVSKQLYCNVCFSFLPCWLNHNFPLFPSFFKSLHISDIRLFLQFPS